MWEKVDTIMVSLLCLVFMIIIVVAYHYSTKNSQEYDACTKKCEKICREVK